MPVPSGKGRNSFCLEGITHRLLEGHDNSILEQQQQQQRKSITPATFWETRTKGGPLVPGMALDVLAINLTSC